VGLLEPIKPIAVAVLLSLLAFQFAQTVDSTFATLSFSSSLVQAQGDVQGALTYYMKAGLPGRAAQLVMRQPDLANSRELIERVRPCAPTVVPPHVLKTARLTPRDVCLHLQCWTHAPSFSESKTRLVAH
jgi:hypothetical protein